MTCLLLRHCFICVFRFPSNRTFGYTYSDQVIHSTSLQVTTHTEWDKSRCKVITYILYTVYLLLAYLALPSLTLSHSYLNPDSFLRIQQFLN
jgi:hypothetical protein